MSEDKKRKAVDRVETHKPNRTFSYFDNKPKDKKDESDDLNIPSGVDWRKFNGTDSSNARIWVDTLNRVNALITMRHFDSFNDFVMTMLDEYEENISENDYKYQELIIQMYNNKKKEDS